MSPSLLDAQILSPVILSPNVLSPAILKAEAVIKKIILNWKIF